MGIKTQLFMIAALGCAALLLLRWSPSDTVKINYSAGANVRGQLLGEGGKGQHKGCAAAASPKPPVSIEWTGRESMTVSYKEGVDVEVYKHEFPGSTLCAWLSVCVCGLMQELAFSLLLTPTPPFPPLTHTHQGWTFGTA